MEQWLRDLEALRLENARLKNVEADLAAALEALRESEERLRLAVDAAQMGLWEWDISSNRVIWDTKQDELFGLTQGSFAGTKEAFFELVHPADRLMLETALGRALTDGAPYQNEFRIVVPAGDTRWIANLGQVYRDDEGRPSRMIGVVCDVTARKLTEQELRETHKMDGIGRLAGGLAHDFNNLLTVILAHVDLAEGPADSPAQFDLQVIREAAQRGASLTRQLLTFARKQIIEPRMVNLNDQVEGMATMLRRLIGEDVELVTELSSGLWSVWADPAQLDLVLMNFAVNAREATPDGGTLTIATANVARDSEDAPLGPDVTPGEYVMMAVSDTGAGMTEEIAQRIFEPFFTTKERGPGSTGLGLATCYGVVAQQGGHIRVHTRPGKGTTFRIYLSRLPVAVATQEQADTPLARPAERETVLVVEDDAPVRQVAIRILSAGGYSVLEAASGEEALAVARAFSGRIHLLVTDVVMPRMGGRELAARLQQERPGIKTLYVSGYTENAVVHQGVVDRNVNFLQKPFVPGSLVRKVREVLARSI
jgi:PAS domain S-box-containing protein